MKKFGVIAFFVLGVTFSVSAQQGFAVKAGINNVTAKVDLGSFGDASDSELGFYVGGGYNFELSDKIDLEPSALLSIVSDLTSLYIPVMFKYEVVESFNVQAGPQVHYLLEDVPDVVYKIRITGTGRPNRRVTAFLEGQPREEWVCVVP